MGTTNTRPHRSATNLGLRVVAVVLLSGASIALAGVAFAAPEPLPQVDPTTPTDQSGDIDAATNARRSAMAAGTWTLGLRNQFGEVVTGAESEFWIDGTSTVGGGTVTEIRWDFGAPNADGFQIATTPDMGTPDAPSVMHVYETLGPVTVTATLVVDSPATTATPSPTPAGCGPAPDPATGDTWQAWTDPLGCPAPLLPVCSVGDTLNAPERDAVTGDIVRPVTCQGPDVTVAPQHVEIDVTQNLQAVSFQVSGVDSDGLGGVAGATPGSAAQRTNGPTGVSGIQYTTAVANTPPQHLSTQDGSHASSGNATSNGTATSDGTDAASSGNPASSGFPAVGLTASTSVVSTNGTGGATGGSGLPVGTTVLLASTQVVSSDPRENRPSIVVGNRTIDMAELESLLGRSLDAPAVTRSDEELIDSIVGFDWDPDDGLYTLPELSIEQLEALARRFPETEDFIAELARRLNVEVTFLREQVGMKGNGKGIWGGRYSVGIPGAATDERRGQNSNSYKRVSFLGRSAARAAGRATTMRSTFETARNEVPLLDLLATMLQSGEHRGSNADLQKVLRDLAMAWDPTAAAGIDLTTTTLVGQRIVGDWRDDTVTLYGNTTGSVVELGAGRNSVEVIDGIIANSQIATGVFDDTVTMTNVQLAGSTVTLGQGTDILQLAGTVTDSRIEQGDGASTIDLAGIIDSSTIDLGDGNDTLNVTGEVSGTRILTGSGDDIFTLISRATAVTAELGDGDDTFHVSGVGDGLTLDLGEGVDTVVIDSGFTGTIVIDDPTYGWVNKSDVRDQDRVILNGDGWARHEGSETTFVRRTAAGAEAARVVLGSNNVEMVSTGAGEVLLNRKPKPPRRSFFSRLLSWVAPIAAIAGLFFPPLLVVAGIASTAQAIIAGCVLCAFAAFASVVPGGAWISRVVNAVQGAVNNNWISGLSGLVPGITSKIGAFVENVIDKQPLRAIASGASVLGAGVGGSNGATIATVGNGINTVGQFIQSPSLGTAENAITSAVTGIRGIENERRRETFVPTGSPLAGPNISDGASKAARAALTPGFGAGAEEPTTGTTGPLPGQPRTLEQLQSGILGERLTPEEAADKLERLQATIPDGNILTDRLGPGAIPSGVLDQLQSSVGRRIIPVPGVDDSGQLVYTPDGGGTGGAALLAPLAGSQYGAAAISPWGLVVVGGGTLVYLGVRAANNAAERGALIRSLDDGDVSRFMSLLADRQGDPDWTRTTLDFGQQVVAQLRGNNWNQAIPVLANLLISYGVIDDRTAALQLAEQAAFAFRYENGLNLISLGSLDDILDSVPIAGATSGAPAAVLPPPPASRSPRTPPAPVPVRDLNAEEGLRAIIDGRYANSDGDAETAITWLIDSYNSGSISLEEFVVASRYQIVRRGSSIVTQYARIVDGGGVITDAMIDFYNDQVVNLSNLLEGQVGHEILDPQNGDALNDALADVIARQNASSAAGGGSDPTSQPSTSSAGDPQIGRSLSSIAAGGYANSAAAATSAIDWLGQVYAAEAITRDEYVQALQNQIIRRGNSMLAEYARLREQGGAVTQQMVNAFDADVIDRAITLGAQTGTSILSATDVNTYRDALDRLFASQSPTNEPTRQTQNPPAVTTSSSDGDDNGPDIALPPFNVPNPQARILDPQGQPATAAAGATPPPDDPDDDDDKKPDPDSPWAPILGNVGTAAAAAFVGGFSANYTVTKVLRPQLERTQQRAATPVLDLLTSNGAVGSSSITFGQSRMPLDQFVNISRQSIVPLNDYEILQALRRTPEWARILRQAELTTSTIDGAQLEAEAVALSRKVRGPADLLYSEPSTSAGVGQVAVGGIVIPRIVRQTLPYAGAAVVGTAVGFGVNELSSGSVRSYNRESELAGNSLASGDTLDEWLATGGQSFRLAVVPDVVEDELSPDAGRRLDGSTITAISQTGGGVDLEAFVRIAREREFSDASIEDALRSMPEGQFARLLVEVGEINIPNSITNGSEPITTPGGGGNSAP